jgi:ech hydrogenase subunit E
MPYTIPVGPYHPALEEPYKLNVSCKGEVIQNVEIEIGFSFRSIELLAQRRNYIQDITLVERVCGICSCVHTMAFCQTAEKIAGIEVPARAKYIRLIMVELERLHSHLLWSGVGAEVMGFQTLFMEAFQLRERVMDLFELLSGNRVHYAANCLGGVNFDIPDPSKIREVVGTIRSTLQNLIVPAFMESKTVKARSAGVGILTREDALRYGTVGPIARASGLKMDVRADSPYLPYQELGFKMITAEECDVRARIVVRALEMLESVRLIEAALDNLPVGRLCISDPFPVIPVGEATGCAEAPRGELFYYIESDGSDIPRRVKIRTPSYVNIPSIRAMVNGQQLGDLTLIQATVDPCCSCTDR